MGATAVQEADAKLATSAAHSLDDAQADKTGDLRTPENNIPEPSQIESEEEFVCSNASVPLLPKVDKMVSSLAGQMDNEAYEMALSNSHKMDLGLSKVTSSMDREEDNLVTSAPTEKEDGSSSSYIDHTEHDDNDEEQSLDGATDLTIGEVTHSTHDEGDLQEDSRALSPIGQQEPRSETEAHADDVQIDNLEEDTSSCVGLLASVVVSEGSEPIDKEETLHVSIPEIVVSSPVPTDDECSDAGSAVEGDMNDVQQEVDDNRTERRDVADNQSHSDSSRKSPRYSQEKESHKSEADTFTNGTKDNTSPKQEGGISKILHEGNLLPFRSTKDYSVSKEASTEKPDKETIADQSSSTVSQESVPNLGERASSLLSQLRSEIASMKTARLSSVSPIIASESDGNATERSQERDTPQPTSQDRDTPQPTSQERDTTQPGPVSPVTYRLPLFEDLDSACTSFSLDDLLSDPVIEEDANSASEADNIHEGAES